jgi:hypothetical protein
MTHFRSRVQKGAKRTEAMFERFIFSHKGAVHMVGFALLLQQQQ